MCCAFITGCEFIFSGCGGFCSLLVAFDGDCNSLVFVGDFNCLGSFVGVECGNGDLWDDCGVCLLLFFFLSFCGVAVLDFTDTGELYRDIKGNGEVYVVEFWWGLCCLGVVLFCSC